MAIVPAMQMFVVTGRTRDDVDEALDSKMLGHSASTPRMSILLATARSTRWVPASRRPGSGPYDIDEQNGP